MYDKTVTINDCEYLFEYDFHSSHALLKASFIQCNTKGIDFYHPAHSTQADKGETFR